MNLLVAQGTAPTNSLPANSNSFCMLMIFANSWTQIRPHSFEPDLDPSCLTLIWAAIWDFQQCGMCDQQSLRSACTYVQSDQSLCWSLEYLMTVKLLTLHHLEFLSLKGGYTGLSKSIHVKLPLCWKSHAPAHIFLTLWSLILIL